MSSSTFNIDTTWENGATTTETVAAATADAALEDVRDREGVVVASWVNPDPGPYGWSRIEAADADDADSWFSSDADEAHQQYLDELGHVNEDDDVDVAEDSL